MISFIPHEDDTAIFEAKGSIHVEIVILLYK